MTDSIHTLRIQHAQDDRWYVVGQFQHTYGKPYGYATRAEAVAVRDEWESEEEIDD